MQRRELFSFLSASIHDAAKEKQEQVLVVRPPYFKETLEDETSAFDIECQNCEGLCATSCQEHIIVIGEDKTPRLDLSSSGCTYCDDCATACEPNVLNIEDKRLINAAVTIDKTKCMSWEGVMCFSCKDPCLEDAIDFKAMFTPVIDASKCTSCGFCISRCPSYAIMVEEKI